MFKNYFKSALRNILKNKGYSFINITGLAVGMACCLLIFVFVLDELSYDRFNKNADRIYRISLSFSFGGRDSVVPTVSAPMGHTLVREYPEVESAVRFRHLGSLIIGYEEKIFRESKVVFSDAEFFKIFTIPLLAGDPATALKDPYSVVFSKKAAEKYFADQDPLGKIIKLSNYDFKVTGVYDQIPSNSHFHFDLIASLSSLGESQRQNWGNNNYYTYILLDKHAQKKSAEDKIQGVIEKYINPQIEKELGVSAKELEKTSGLRTSFFLQPLPDIHLHSNLSGELEPNSDIKYIYIFSAVALFILIIASINFINLATARSAGRAREVGMRKVMGSAQPQLIRQFLGESTIMSVISLLAAFVLIILAIGYFNQLSGKETSILDFLNLEMVTAMLTVVIAVGLLAGLYPALFLSAFKPVNVLRGEIRAGVKTGWLRSSLVVIQFAASVILIICTLVVRNQLHYIKDKNVGYDKDNVLILQNANLLGSQVETFKNEILKHPGVINGTISSYLPVPSTRHNITLYPDGNVSGGKTSAMIQNWSVDYDYIKTLGIKILKGRDFSRSFPTDKSAVILNQKAAKQFGWGNNPLGKKLGRTSGKKEDMELFTVIGVVEDFHFESLRNTIAPLALFLERSANLISFRIKPENIPDKIDFLRTQWKKFLPGKPFDYTFMDEDFNAEYRAEQRLGKIFGFFALLAIFIGCLGLFGLAAFTAQQKTKDIGIRKVLGASVPNLIRLIAKEFIILVCIANIIAWPIAYIIMNKWMQDFAYRVSLTIGTFIIASIASIVIALLTVSYQSIKAALANPVDSLKYE